MIYAENLEQLQEVIRTAAANGKGLVPVSSGAPHIHGASENTSAETVSFEKMDRILKTDRRNRYARVEAGVTFGQLLPEMEKAGLRLNHPFLPRADKSVTASMLEREGVMVPKYQYDYTDPLLTVEVVYGTGEVFRTGSAAGPGSPEELTADMVCPWGPGSIDFLRFLCGAQGTMGFVTWATLKAEVKPAQSKLFFVESETAEPLTKLVNELTLQRIPDDCIILNAVNFGAAFGKDEADAKTLREKAAPWTLICRISGYERYPEERIGIYTGYLKDTCAAAGLRALESPSALPDIAAAVDARISDCDRSETYWKMRRGGCREILFLAPPSKTPALVALMEKELAALPAELRGITLQPQVQGRAFRVECDCFYAAAEQEKTLAVCAAAEKALFAAGAYFDRPYGELPALVYAAQPEATEALRKVKAVFDPAGILNRGKLCF